MPVDVEARSSAPPGCDQPRRRARGPRSTLAVGRVAEHAVGGDRRGRPRSAAAASGRPRTRWRRRPAGRPAPTRARGTAASRSRSRPACASRAGQRRRGPGDGALLVAQQVDRLGQGRGVAAVAVDEDHARRPAAGRAAVLRRAAGAAPRGRSRWCRGSPRARRWRRSSATARPATGRPVASSRSAAARVTAWRSSCPWRAAGAGRAARPSRPAPAAAAEPGSSDGQRCWPSAERRGRRHGGPVASAGSAPAHRPASGLSSQAWSGRRW